MDPALRKRVRSETSCGPACARLRPEIDLLAAGDGQPAEHQRKLVVLLARIVAAEMDFRVRDAAAE